MMFFDVRVHVYTKRSANKAACIHAHDDLSYIIIISYCVYYTYYIVQVPISFVRNFLSTTYGTGRVSSGKEKKCWIKIKRS